MGGPLANRLLYRNQVFGTNRTRSKASALMANGLIWRDTPREVAAAADVVFSMITDDAALAAITAGPDGILAGLRPGALYIDMSTVSPGASRELSKRVCSAGATMVDAPVSGAVTHVGGNGQGLLLDLAINISTAAQMIAFHEGVMLAARGGIDPALTARAMKEFAHGSAMARPHLSLAFDPPRQARCDVALMHKGIRLALENARSSGLQLPLAAAVEGALGRVKESGYAHRDITGLYEGLART
jgi:3-hydroxyisobutyrate dehydrogenase-like beta-hydroxyacid dehydrogenase